MRYLVIWGLGLRPWDNKSNRGSTRFSILVPPAHCAGGLLWGGLFRRPCHPGSSLHSHRDCARTGQWRWQRRVAVEGAFPSGV